MTVDIEVLSDPSRFDALAEDWDRLVTENPEIDSLINCKTIQQGPGEVLVCMKIKCVPNISTERLSILINSFEKELRQKRSDVKWIYVEPDLQEWKNK